MTAPANWAGRALRAYGAWELRLDRAVLAAALAAALPGAAILLVLAARRGDPALIAAVALYALGLWGTLGCALAYHLTRQSAAKEMLRRFDHAAIFLMIAGTYGPFAAVGLGGALSIVFAAAVWTVALAGMAMKLALPRRFERISIVAYLALGAAVIAALIPVFGALGVTVIALLAIGAALYVAGVAFHMWDALRFQNAIWHAFMVAAAGCHFAAVARVVSAPG